MNILFLSLMHPRSRYEEIQKNAKHGLQMQIESLQRALLEGIRGHQKEGERLAILNALPVGIFPIHYQQWWLRGGQSDENMTELASINLPFLKQWGRKRGAIHQIKRWVKEDPANRTIVMYTIYLPFLQAVWAVKKQVPDLKICVIVTDLPNQLGISSGRTGWLKKVETWMGNRSLALLGKMDAFVLLTKHMAEVLPAHGKAQVVIEGIIRSQSMEKESENTERPTFLYTGTLNKELGIADLIKAFGDMPDCDLWLCGAGDMDEEAKEASQRFKNITYYGFVPQEKAIDLQSKATALINPRSANGVYTRYSFPSKTLEYMRSGKPVLCYHLEGIPSDYDPYLHYIQTEGAQGIVEAVRQLLQMPDETRRQQAMDAKAYVQRFKNPQAQCDSLMSMLRGL